MPRRPFQFGLSSLMWMIAFVAINFWMFSWGAWGGIIALVIDKHLLVAYLCMKAQVDMHDARAAGRVIANCPALDPIARPLYPVDEEPAAERALDSSRALNAA